MQRLKSKIFVSAYLRRCQSNGAFATILQKGEEEGGLIAIKVCKMDGNAIAYLESRTRDYQLYWRPLTEDFSPEAQIDTLLAKELEFDSDLWIVEVEDRQGRHFLQETVGLSG